MQYGEEKEGEDKRGQGLRKFVLRWTCEKAELAKKKIELAKTWTALKETRGG